MTRKRPVEIHIKSTKDGTFGEWRLTIKEGQSVANMCAYFGDGSYPQKWHIIGHPSLAITDQTVVVNKPALEHIKKVLSRLLGCPVHIKGKFAPWKHENPG